MKKFAIHLGAQIAALLIYACLIAFIVWGESPGEWSDEGRLLVALLWLCASAYAGLFAHAAIEGDLP